MQSLIQPPMPQGKNSGWIYRRPDIEGISELGIFDGSQGLAAHFHDELQISFVLRGWRTFRIGGEATVLSAGQCICIPANVPHRSLAGSSDLWSINVYVPPGDYTVDAMTRVIEHMSKSTWHLHLRELAAVIQSHRQDTNDAPAGGAVPIRADSQESVGALAKRLGQSREGFSRSFAARFGMPPHAFRLAARLNHAREMLRAGEPVAAAAAEAGFADQSHLGRCFRRAFGITPGRYRLG